MALKLPLIRNCTAIVSLVGPQLRTPWGLVVRRFLGRTSSSARAIYSWVGVLHRSHNTSLSAHFGFRFTFGGAPGISFKKKLGS